MPIKNHIEKSLEISPGSAPFYQMLTSACAMTIPLIIGFMRAEIQPAMFGALMGLVFYLNDHFGRLVPRLKHLLVTFTLLILSMVLGTFVQSQPWIISLIIFVLSFLLGKSKSFGIELERMMLFVTLHFLTTSSESIVRDQRDVLLGYSLFSFLSYVSVVVLVSWLFRHETKAMNSKRQTFAAAMSNKQSLRFSLIFAIIALASHHLAILFQLSRSYWLVGTAVIVMLPDGKLGIYRSFQRLIGTIGGVLVGALILGLFSDPRLILIFIFLFALYVPVGLAKNYWVGNFFMAAIILFFIEIAKPQSIATQHLAYWRIVDIACGSLLGMTAAFVMQPELFKSLSRNLRLKNNR